MNNSDNRIQWRIPLFYALFAGAWILFSDRILEFFTSDAVQLTKLQTAKGWVFVLVTSLMLFSLLRQELRLRSRTERERFHLQIKEQLARSQVEQERERYRDLFEANPMPMWVYDQETFAFLAVNEAALAHYGYTRDEFLGMKIQDIHLPQDLPNLIVVMKSLPGAFRKPGIWRQKKKNGLIIDVEITTHDLIYAGRSARLVLASDQTERLRAEALLHEANENLKAIVLASPIAIIAVDQGTQVRMWNPAATRLFGWSEEEMLGKPLPFVPPDKQSEYSDFREMLAKGEVIMGVETKRVRKDGTLIDIALSMAPLRDARGAIIGFMAVISDISDRKRAEVEILSQAKFPSENPHPVLRLSHAGVLLTANHSSQPILQEWGCQIGDTVPPTWRAMVDEALETQTVKTVEVPANSRVYSCSLVPIPDGDYVNLYGYDITDRKQAQEHLHRQYQKMAALRTIDLAITASLDLRLLLEILLDQIMEQTNAHAANVLLLNPELNALETSASRGFHEPQAPYHLAWGEVFAGSIIEERQAITVTDLRLQSIESTSSSLKELVSREGFVSYFGFPLIAKGQIRGVLELFHRSLFTPDQEWLDFVETLAGQAAIAIDNASLFEALQHSNVDLSLAYDATIEGWSRALDLRDRETEGHTQRVTELTLQLARRMEIGEAELVHIRRGALLHDMGKLGVPDRILFKEGSLTADEWEVMRKHPVYAYDMISPITYLRPALDIPYCHHERWDGSGYPCGLKGEEIPLPARIFAVVDVWDALISPRPYRPAWEPEVAARFLKENAGVLFDPHVYRAFEGLMKW
jgi:PAS domain S-box-containing protein